MRCRIVGILFGLISFADFGNATTSTQPPTLLIVKKSPIQVNGKASTVFKIEQPNGVWGYRGVKGRFFDVTVKNQTDVPTVLHWHGLLLPNSEDGVPFVTQLPIPPGGEYHYRFKLKQSGTYWMHSHLGLQEQQLLSAPLIIADPFDTTKEKEVILFLTDFSFKKPETILADLEKPGPHQTEGSHQEKSDSTLNDVKYDAFLTNYRTLRDPEIVRVKPGETIRLRVIDAASMSNFFINTGVLAAQAIAIDGHDIAPILQTIFQLAVGQRVDIRVKIPPKEGVYPILAQSEGTDMQTGLILATPHARINLPSEHAKKVVGALDYTQEFKIKALHPLSPKLPDQTLMVNLEGNMMHYVWMINHQIWPHVKPLKIKKNNRVEVIFKNDSAMSHPMHLHGHVFAVMEIDGHKLTDGAMRDTVLVLPGSTVKIQFDADSPGNWVMHCHMVYHMATGMITLVNYEDVKLPPWLPFTG